MSSVNVVKRNKTLQLFSRQKLTARLKNLCFGLDAKFVDVEKVVEKVYEGIFDSIPTSQVDNLLAETTAYLSVYHSDYSKLAGRIKISGLHKITSPKFSEVAKALHDYIQPITGKPAPLLSDDVHQVVQDNAEAIDNAIVHARDFQYEYFGFKTLERSYLLKLENKIVERPQYLLMRVALGIHGADLKAAFETYDLLSQGFFIHASPTLFNAATPNPQMSSCFLLTMKSDSIDGIYDTLKTCALISKSAGGIGLAVHKIRASGSYIRGTNGTSNGLVPMLRVFNDTARYVDQGGGKRKGAFAVYLEPWHSDIYHFLDLRKNNGKEEIRARDLFYALWIPDLFMARVEANGTWSLFCPNEAPGLADCWGEEFEKLYTKYEKEGKARKVVKAQDLWFSILESQTETGNPYMLYKDHCNRKSNQQNLGTIQCSNLCTEIVEYTAPDEVAVCNLASIALPKYVKFDDAGKPYFDHKLLFEITKVITKNLNKIIDLNYYPVIEAKNSNMRHRPIGIGVQGLADAFILMRFPFESAQAKALNAAIFETIYYGALTASMELAAVLGTYSTYKGSPMSQGKLQFDMWDSVILSGNWDWDSLRKQIAVHGVRNSLLVAPMPTASTSQILGNNECIEPYTSNIYTRRVLSGEFPVVNHHLIRDLIAEGKWNSDIVNAIIAHQGSIQNIPGVSQELKELYKTAWEIKQRAIIDLAADRAPFICQSQSLNAFIAEPSNSKLTAMHFYAWKKGLKTGMYYLRSRPAADAIQFTVDQQQLKQTIASETAPEKASPPSPSKAVACPRRKKGMPQNEECLVCGS